MIAGASSARHRRISRRTGICARGSGASSQAAARRHGGAQRQSPDDGQRLQTVTGRGDPRRQDRRHLHLSAFALVLPPLSYNVDTATIVELVDIVRSAVAASATPNEWIRGQGWNDNRLPRPPDRTDLDPVSGDHPVILTDFSFHAVAVNSKALQLAGITRDTVAPDGGVIEKDAGVASIVPPRTEVEISQGLDSSIALLGL
ncbi:amidohydrolase family protein [Streptomyces sp. NPDC013187]|uniref:amidohydrolase family protein n=1 Tax=Streptomyces sp. NPDC013187 TaxID=3364865 RepID=UPI0036CAE2EF